MTVKEKVTQLLKTLSPDEQILLSKVLSIEKERLHQKQPQVKEEMLKAVREAIK